MKIDFKENYHIVEKVFLQYNFTSNFREQCKWFGKQKS